MSNDIILDAPEGMQLSVDVPSRTITGIAITTEPFQHPLTGETLKFSAGSVKPWRSHVPMLFSHDDHKPVGKLTSEMYDEDGNWVVTFKLGKTALADEVLALASEGMLGGLSCGIRDALVDKDGTITSAAAYEISAVSQPAIAGAVITGVALSATPPNESKEVEMPEEIEAGAEMELSAPQGPDIHPIPLVGAKDNDPNPYPHLYGHAPGEHSLFKDMRLAETNEGAAERLQTLLHFDRKRKIDLMRLAVSTASLPPSDPPIRQDLYWDEVSDPGNPLLGLVNTGTLTNTNPFYAPSYDSTAEDNLSNPHVEGVEPVLGDLGAFNRALVTPVGVSGKIALTREAVDFSDSNPQMEALAFRRMDVARRRAQEEAFVTYLNGLTLATENVVPISRANPVGDVINLLAGMAYRVDGGRFTRLIASQGTFGDLVGQKDTTGRHMLPIIQPTNAMGNTSDSVQAVYIGSTLVRPVQGLGATNSYLFDPSELWVWNSRVLNLRMDYEVAWVRLGHIALQAQHVIDKGGIIRLTRSAT